MKHNPLETVSLPVMERHLESWTSPAYDLLGTGKPTHVHLYRTRCPGSTTSARDIVGKLPATVQTYSYEGE